MKLIHLSDLHIGKRLNEYSLIEDQKYILKQIEEIIDREKPDGVMIAGDVYDVTAPSGEAMTTFGTFAANLMKKGVPVFTVSGNHDSAERIAYGADIFSASNVYMSPVYAKNSVKPITLEDAYGPVHIYMMPFIKPVHVRAAFRDEEEAQKISTYTEAMRFAVSKMNVDFSARNVLIAHQYVTGSERSESEEKNIGTLDNVDASVFEDFDYVALGHLHRPQNCVGTTHIRYCGTPLKYSLSEVHNQKSVTIVELGEKGNVSYRTVDLQPLRNVVEIEGSLAELLNPSYYAGTTYDSDYVYVKLTDENLIPNVAAKLRNVYKKFVNVNFVNFRSSALPERMEAAKIDEKSPTELFEDLYRLSYNRGFKEEERELVDRLFEEKKEG